MISLDKILSVWLCQRIQWLRSSLRVDCGAVIQITGYKDRIRLLPQNFSDHAPQKAAVSHVPQMHIANQRRSSPAPCVRQVCEPHCCSRDSCPACVENSVEPDYHRRTEEQFHHSMKAHSHTKEPHDSEDDP